MRTLAEQVDFILADKARVPVRNGIVRLRGGKGSGGKVMRIEVDGVPTGVAAINMDRIGSLSGLRGGPWKSVCDYLFIWCRSGAIKVFFIELKTTLADEGKGKEQLRRSQPYLEYLRSVCRVHFGTADEAIRVMTIFVLIGGQSSARMSKERTGRGHLAGTEIHRGITVRRLVAGAKLPFAWLEGRS